VATHHSPYLKQRLIVVSNYFIAGGTFAEFEVADPATRQNYIEPFSKV
jgi:hypothetical protein